MTPAQRLHLWTHLGIGCDVCGLPDLAIECAFVVLTLEALEN